MVDKLFMDNLIFTTCSRGVFHINKRGKNIEVNSGMIFSATMFKLNVIVQSVGLTMKRTPNLLVWMHFP